MPTEEFCIFDIKDTSSVNTALDLIAQRKRAKTMVSLHKVNAISKHKDFTESVQHLKVPAVEKRKSRSKSVLVVSPRA